jgi:hypothetical protein
MPNTVSVGYQWVSPEQVELAWKPSPNATAYRLEEASSPGVEDATLLADLTDGRQVHYEFSPPSTGARYYRVTPLNQGVPGAPSEPINPTPLVLNPPTMRPVQWSSDGGYYVRWTPIPQATATKAQTSDEPDFPRTGRLSIAAAAVSRSIRRPIAITARGDQCLLRHSPSPWSGRSDPRRGSIRRPLPASRRNGSNGSRCQRQYVIRAKCSVTTKAGRGFFTRNRRAAWRVGATYRVRMRHPDDAPPANGRTTSPRKNLPGGDPRPGAAWVLLGVALVALSAWRWA